ncbi:uncharacterized protein CANTADRAFT_22791 [Suhomyces tanzawaensis NRRL Y-17324]|uniref:F-box domain-containing protein n=1 Tax=Suhomyces tanzawaensis NRRL Y-17324 TaxID=984487 RepID=A0A1E4SH57_9ASCO|nr:uncharacterized protein CANTADRAFT_22791 [Suhomyces tanzawaensis NRRL Y-17324]ODV78844.1 hypothetical protein CANTADRAFT_22791 [Suhomyces tanzawaensis NRRL Y-17324]
MVCVIRYGNLAVDDVLSMSRASSGLRQALDHEIIWKEAFLHEWGSIINDYELTVPVAMYHQACVSFACRRNTLVQRIHNSTIRSNKEMSAFLDRHMHLHDFVVALRLYKDAEHQLLLESPVDFKLLHVVNTLIIRHNYSIAINWVHQHLHNLEFDHDYEQFWFKIGHFGKSFHKYVHLRHRVLSRIRRRAHSEITHNILYNGSNPKIRLENSTIYFASNEAFIKFMKTFASVILDSLEFEPPVLSGYSVSPDQGHTILSIYSGIEWGESTVLYAIMVKIFREILDKYNIKVGDQQASPFTAHITAQFIRVHDYYLGLEKNPLTNINDVPVMMSSATYKRFLARTMNISIRDDKLEPFVSPIRFSHLVEYYKLANLQFGIPEEQFEGDDPLFIDVKTQQELNFIKTLLRFLSLKQVSGYTTYLFCLELYLCLKELNNAIHILTLMELYASQDLCVLQEYLVMSDARYEYTNGISERFKSGCLVYHDEKEDIGIFIKYKLLTYAKILRLGSRWDEVIHEVDLELFMPSSAQKLLTYREFGFDILGLYFKDIDNNMELIPYKKDDIEDYTFR